MDSIDLNNFYSGGYFLIREGKTEWLQTSSNLLPDKLLSLSNHVGSEKFSVFWGWPTGDRDSALKFGIPKNRLDEFVEWCSGEYEAWLDIDALFYSPQNARDFVRRFEIEPTSLHIIGIGLPRELRSNWDEETYEYGITKFIKEQHSLAGGGMVLTRFGGG
jgi:hypothetical protein